MDADFGAALAAAGRGGAGSSGRSSSSSGGDGEGDGNRSSSSSGGGSASGGGGPRGGGLVVPRRARARLFVDTAYGAAALGAAEALVSRLGRGAPAAGPQKRRPEGQVVELVVAYLTSYEHMGRARLSCFGGCGCEPLEIDAHHRERTSVSSTAVLPLWQAGGTGGGGLARCGLRVEVLRGSSSGESKFKVIQVVTRAREVAPEVAAAAAAEAGAGQDAPGGAVAGGGGRRGASRRRAV